MDDRHDRNQGHHGTLVRYSVRYRPRQWPEVRFYEHNCPDRETAIADAQALAEVDPESGTYEVVDHSDWSTIFVAGAKT